MPDSRNMLGCQVYQQANLPTDWVCEPLGNRIRLRYGVGLTEENRIEGEYNVYGSNGVVGTHNEALVEAPGILVGRKGSVGAVHYAEEPFFPIDTVYYIERLRDDSFRYLFYLLDYLNLSRLNAATGVPGLTRKDALSMRGAFPRPDEQEAIAKILDAVDEAVKRTRTTLENARIVKRGLMQSLLPQWIGFKKLDSSVLPKGFEIERASDVAKVVNGTTPSREEPAYWRQGTLAWLATGKVNERIITTANEYVTPKALAECSIELLPKGTVLVAMIGQGKTRGMCAYLELDACINQNFGAFVPKPRLIGKYLYHYFDYHYNSLREMGGGTNQGALNCYMLKRLRLPMPLRERQIEIAEQLDTCDAVIQKHLDSLSTLEILKRGLMQDLLTGKVRVSQLVTAESAGD